MSDPLVVAEKVSGPLPELTADEIDAAAKRISDIIEPTPLQRNPRLSALTGAEVYLKREDLTAVRSYKLRGAYNLMVQLTDVEKAAGVVTASAGNHAQGVAFACKAMGVQGRIYVPRTTPKQKRDRIRVHGGEFVELIAVGDTYDAAAAAAADDAARTGATMVPPFDDPRTAAGQGTIAAEFLEQLGF
ncbi:pyridoxal-phosphate dependent enzyme, partial [Nocardia tengchongensis]|uniref:pyridoxal-phosphate dependent enzyme n=1 Tax=Nocardia tengchongensis TaxID=2055889 RepID=UPI0036C3E217